MTEDRFSLKDALFNEQKVSYLGGLFAQADPSFDRVGFERDVMANLLSLELKQRVSLIAEVLARYLPADFPTAIAGVLAALPEPLDPLKTDDDFGDFIFGPLGEFVSTHGMGHFDLSMQALRELTMRFSMEFTLRHFLNENPARVMEFLQDWVTDENYHVRRLVSEGTRPRLPWGVNVGLHVQEPIPFLDHLYRDKTRYVTRSVANHLNDVAKVDADLVVQTLKRWKGEAGQTEKEMDWIMRHALRTLVKKGDSAALAVLGYQPDPPIDVGQLALPDTVAIGDALSFELNVQANSATRLMVDFVIEFVKADGRRKPKVFKLKQVEMTAGQRIVLGKSHRFKGNATTFKLYPGTHRLAVQINGVEYAAGEFELLI